MEVGPMEVGPDEVGPDWIGPVEVGPDDVPVGVGPVVVGGESSLEMTSAITVAAMTRMTTTIATKAMPLKGFFRGSLGGGSGCIPHSRLGRLRPVIVNTTPSRRAARAPGASVRRAPIPK